MPSQDYLDGFDAAKRAAEKVATDEAAAAKLELDNNLASSVRERTEVRQAYSEKIAQRIRKLQP